MYSYRLILQYKGTAFFGWQVQPHRQTIQGELNKALMKIAKSKEIYSVGASRTDAGVHALGQVARVDIPLDIPAHNLLLGLNSFFPPEIRIVDAQKCAADFDPIRGAKQKFYQYRFTKGEAPPAPLCDLLSIGPGDLDVNLMQKGCQLFLGEHDFVNFFTTGTPVKSTVRTISVCELEFTPAEHFFSRVYDGYYSFSFVGNGFLKQMIRLMVGALWNLGKHKIDLAQLKGSLKMPQQEKLAATALPHGLFLVENFLLKILVV